MKHILSALFLLLVSTAGTFAQDKIASLSVKTTFYCDHCKQCGSCGERITEAVFTEKGIKRVDIDEKEMAINVVYNTRKTDADKIRKAIAASGFDADELKAEPTAVAALDACCKRK